MPIAADPSLPSGTSGGIGPRAVRPTVARRRGQRWHAGLPGSFLPTPV